MSKIEWTGKTWNPTTGCTKISAGCKFCYAEIMTRRLNAIGLSKYAAGFGKVVTHPKELKRPYTWKKPQVIFVNSMSDLFHKDVPTDFVKQVFKVMNDLPQHTFQVLTKRSDRLVQLSNSLNWTSNIWMGLSIENEKVLHRLEDLRHTSAAVKFLSLEPLIGALPELNLSGIDWVIVGGESGHTPREIKKEWVIDIRNQCHDQNIPFFFKQWGGKNKKKSGRLLDGKVYDEMPLQYYNNRCDLKGKEDSTFFKANTNSIPIASKTDINLVEEIGLEKIENILRKIT